LNAILCYQQNKIDIFGGTFFFSPINHCSRVLHTALQQISDCTDM
jgi:hypothetical protein